MKILLAEDEKDMSSALTAILQHSGYDVDSVYDGQAAMEKALENVYDCLIFDIMMPKMSGIDAPDAETMNRKVAKMVEEALKYTKVESVLSIGEE